MRKDSPYQHVAVLKETYAKIAQIKEETDIPIWAIVKRAVELYAKQNKLK